MMFVPRATPVPVTALEARLVQLAANHPTVCQHLTYADPVTGLSRPPHTRAARGSTPHGGRRPTSSGSRSPWLCLVQLSPS
jgi:hypothetical protein